VRLRVDPGGEEALELLSCASENSERRVRGAGQLRGGVDEPLQKRVERELRAQSDASVDEEAKAIEGGRLGHSCWPISLTPTLDQPLKVPDTIAARTYVNYSYDVPVHRRRHRFHSRNRRRRDDGSWAVRARVERFAEPALLRLLAERPTHGYELLDRLPAFLGEERVDVGNVYRALRALEEEGLVVSEWDAELPGPARRTYTLTEDGHAALAAWLESLATLRDGLATFLEDAPKGGDHVR